MKTIKGVTAFLVLVGTLLMNSVVVQATESRVKVVPVGKCKVEELSQPDMSSSQTVVEGEFNRPEMTRATYEPYRYSDAFDIYIDGRWVAQIDAECIVWHYTDGKVHLYQRTITVERLASFDATRTYGRIVNTDGSLSYTTGDRVRIIDYMEYWDFAIDFRVTPTEASFNCYEV